MNPPPQRNRPKSMSSEVDVNCDLLEWLGKGITEVWQGDYTEEQPLYIDEGLCILGKHESTPPLPRGAIQSQCQVKLMLWLTQVTWKRHYRSVTRNNSPYTLMKAWVQLSVNGVLPGVVPACEGDINQHTRKLRGRRGGHQQILQCC